jgi:eukaryotic-like serine/threonine-protein kinase
MQEVDLPISPIERAVEELRQRWAQGDKALAEEFFSRDPALLQDQSAAIDLIYEEICVREGAGQAGAWEEAFERFPEWRAQLQALRACHQLLQPAEPAPRYPEVGETLGEFRLLAELGRGGRGRVFLASQPALADRPVVLKLTPRLGDEHVLLARLQHTNIVPLYSARDDRQRQLRLLCMPYLGNATLARLLEALAAVPPAQRTGRDLVQALDRLEGTAPPPLAPVAAARQFLARASYIQAICWIGACCADALHHAHERGLVHLDLKPSNLLVAVDGQPMLLDFHLAQEPLARDETPSATIGGTYAYMAPEHRAAMEGAAEGRPPATEVDGRADLYSLGTILYEALGGRLPAESRLPLCRVNPRVSVGLSDIIHRCLEPDPGRRYPDAAVLAADLRRHLSHQPLQGVANRSLAERWLKWRKRRPIALRRASAVAALLLLALGLTAVTAAYLNERADDGRRALQEGRELWQQQRAYQQAIAVLQHGLARVENLPLGHGLAEELRLQIRRVHQAQDAEARQRLVHDLHRHVEQLRMLSDLEPIPSASLRTLQQSAQALWEKRAQIRERLGEESHAAVDADLRELAIAVADLNVRLASPSERVAARQRALEVLNEAEKLCGGAPILDWERQLCRSAAGAESPLMPPAPLRPDPEGSSSSPDLAREHLVRGRGWLRAGQLDHAAHELKQACDLEPQDAWCNYYRGLCAYRLKQYGEAARAFSVCVGAVPDQAGCYYSRALALACLGRLDEAVQDYNRALQLDPKMVFARVNRGMLHYQAKQYGQALADLEQALADGADPALINYDLALVHLAQADPAAALTCVERALRQNRHHPEAARLRDQLKREASRR